MSFRSSSVHPSRVAEALLWAGAAASAGLAVVGWRAPMPVPAVAAAAPVSRRAPSATPPATAALASYAAELAGYDPFRFTHQPALVAFGAPEPAARPWAPPPGVAAPSMRPRLAVQGFVGARAEWAAVLGGVPGRDGGVLVRAGDTLAGLRVRRITRDTLVVAGADTVWRLTSAGAAPGALPSVAGQPFPMSGGRP